MEYNHVHVFHSGPNEYKTNRINPGKVLPVTLQSNYLSRPTELDQLNVILGPIYSSFTFEF